MKRFASALALCCSLLALLSFVLFPHVEAKEDTLAKLLNLPAPPPPNPSVQQTRRVRSEKFYQAGNPPADDAPIDDLVDYWTTQGDNYGGPLYYSPRPSERTAERLLAEMSANLEMAPRLLKIIEADKRVAEVVTDLYRRSADDDKADRTTRQALKEWLRFNTTEFVEDLERVSLQARDSDGYVDGASEANLLALTTQDFDRANPIISRLYADRSQPVTQTLATWALYRRALRTDSPSDVDRYRRELMDMVEDRSLPDGVRDKANDALTSEADFPGRLDWTISLFEDESLVNMPRFTMLTTLFLTSPPEKYVPKMVELLDKTNKPMVRSAAARALMAVMDRQLPAEMEKEVVRALLPMLEDPKWAAATTGDVRKSLVRKLSEHEIPESVPGLIKLLDEKQAGPQYAANIAGNTAWTGANAGGAAANAAATAANAMANVANTAARSGRVAYSANANAAGVDARQELIGDNYPYRSLAIAALATQKDSRAAQPLRRMLSAVVVYERTIVVRALLLCNGFTTSEQLDAVEARARGIQDEVAAISAGVNTAANKGAAAASFYPYGDGVLKPQPPTPAEIRFWLGQHLLESSLISDALARAVVDRIETLDKDDPQLAAAYRRIVLNWQNGTINLLLLRDLKRGITDSDTIIRLLAQRKMLREKHSTDVFDVRTGSATAVGVAACLLEDMADYDAILDTGNAETRTALFACARLIRAPLSVEKVAAHLSAKEPLLARAAEAYLIAEDSPAARMAVLARHPNEAMILGATTAFADKSTEVESYEFIAELFQSIGNDTIYNGWFGADDEGTLAAERPLQEEVKKDASLIGIYAYDRHYIRIYTDRVIFSWDDDDSRYRERPLSKEEFDEIKSYLASRRADELPPFIYCGGEYCWSKELLMLGRNGGRRVFVTGGFEGKSRKEQDFFTGLDAYFENLKTVPAKLKYVMSRELPGLEIVLARDDLRAATVWGEAGEIRVAASATATREKVKKAIETIEEEESSAETDEEGAESIEQKVNAERERRRYEGYAWYRIAADGTAEIAAQPPDVEFIPLRDGFPVSAGQQRWKARAAGIEIRAASDGLYKLVAGRLTKLLSGNYSRPVVSPDGSWVVASKTDAEGGESLVRINLATRREYPIMFEEYGDWRAAVYVPALGRFLVERGVEEYEAGYGYWDEKDEDEIAPREVSPMFVRPINILTGELVPFSRELRPFAQQTFRPLQKAARTGEYWAAIPDSEANATSVGIIDTRRFAFRQVLRVPKIRFDSMQMWADETRKKLFFVYRGHLLSLPLPV